MQLTQFSDYSLRILIYLGLRPDALATIEEIATAYGISESHLTKVAHRLGQLGIIVTVRGRHGGMRLQTPPAEINIGTTIRQMETNLALVECFNPDHNTCPIAPACALAGILDEALQAFLNVLDQYSLADVIGNPKSLGGLLGVAARGGRPGIRTPG